MKFFLSFLVVVIFLLNISQAQQAEGVCDCDLDQFFASYYCVCKNVTIPNQRGESLATINHKAGYRNEHVSHLYFINSCFESNRPVIWNVFPNIESITMENVQLQRLEPIPNCSKMKDIWLQNNKIRMLTPEILPDCSNLEQLSFNRNEINYVSDAAFDGLQSLKMLDLSANFISEIGQETFKSTRQLEVLFIDNNRLEIITEKQFEYLTNLKQLHLNENLLRNIEETAFARLTSLEYLELWGNNLTQIHKETFATLQNLIELEIYDNQLTSLDWKLPSKNLESLNLIRNEIDSIDPQILRSYSSSLRNLLLSDNKCIDKNFIFIVDFKAEVESKLTTCLDNFYTSSSSIPGNEEICNFYVHNDYGYTCELTNITFHSSNDSFSIAGNHLVGMSLNDVKALIFTNSTLSRIPSNVFSQLPNVEKLIAKKANIKNVDDKTLENCGKLKLVDLADNQISTVAVNAFETCANLTSINLSNNKIPSLPAKLFSQNTNLESIILDRNQIAKIDPCNNAIRQLKKLKELSVKWNICINNSFRHPTLNLQFNQIALKDLNICFGFWFL